MATGKGKKAGAGGAERGGRSPGDLPDPGGTAPFHLLGRDELSVLLYVALLPEEARALAKDLRLSVPGFRTEGLSDVEICDLLADEIRAAPTTGAKVAEKLAAAFGGMPLPFTPLDPDDAEDLLAVGSSEHGLTLALWRVLADPSPEARKRAQPMLAQLVRDYYGPAPGGDGAPRAKPAGKDDQAARVASLEGRLAEAARELEETRGRIESARRKGEEQRAKLQGWLREARAREAQAVDEAARARETAESAQRARERAEAALSQAQATDAAAEAHRLRSVVKDLEGKAAALEGKLARRAEREEELEAALAEARARPEEERPAATAEEGGGGGIGEDPATWLMPVYTKEFYDSLEGWDRRIQRAAFKQANLLALDHRHPSLRALPLEGLPGYYRVRVATDVRLLYRRGERQNTIEILSLIDREDLDRYVRQAKTR